MHVSKDAEDKLVKVSSADTVTDYLSNKVTSSNSTITFAVANPGANEDLNIRLADTAVSPATYGSATQVGQFTVDQQGRLTSASNVAISITSSAITDFTEAAQDAVGASLTDTASIDLTYNDGANTISGVVLPAGVDHDALANFVANEHIDHTSVSINTAANSGLAGGGDISSSRSLSLDVNNLTADTIVSADFIPFYDVSGSDNNKTTFANFITATGAVTTLAAIGSSPNANGATISGNTLNLEPASASFGGVVTTGTQTIAGAKTFSGITTVSNATAAGTGGTGALVVTGGIYSGDGFAISGDIQGIASTVITGGEGASNTLTLRSTTNATKGSILIDETTAATTRSTGALVIGNGTTGGLGVGGRIHSGGLTTYSTINASVNQTHTIGSSTVRFSDIWHMTQKGYINLMTGGSPTFTSGSYASHLFYASGDMTGNTLTALLDSAGGACYSNLVCYTDNLGGTANVIDIQNIGNGNISFGGASAYAATSNEVYHWNVGSGSGIFAFAYMHGGTGAGSSTIALSSGFTSYVFGAVGQNDTSNAVSGNLATLKATNEAAFAQASVNIADSVSSVTAEATASGIGSLVRGSVIRGLARSSNNGSFLSVSNSCTNNTAGSFASGQSSFLIHTYQWTLDLRT